MFEWLMAAALGPAAAALPVNWAADAVAGAAQRWFKRLRRTDDLSRLVRAATGTSVDLTRAEFDAVRHMLEDPQTWQVLGRGTVEDLAILIAACLPARDGRTAEDSHAAGLTIARGLLEFAVADLDPKLFKQVLLARLQRMDTDQASALDKALFGLHAGFDSVLVQLKVILERLPPGPAGRGQIEVYLRTLIDWLSTDPWPRDRRFGGPALTSAAIERKLRVTATGPGREQDLDADGLAKRCRRLVILGGPGSGKTWLAKSTARRCAEDALEALAAGWNLDEVELPLYTTCSRLFGAGGDIRQAAVSSALEQIGDLGGSRLSEALRLLFTERNAPTVLVIDSLDEAHGPGDRLRQASTLPWRIVLTSRPSSWDEQLVIEEGKDSHRVCDLQPLRYPDDVEPFIARWFDGRPERGNGLAAQIARHPGLRQAATVPLILAFYCIVGGSGPLPEYRRELYGKVLNRLLTSRWRGSDDRQPDVDACLDTLRAWAWSGAASHPISGVGTWNDDIFTERTGLGDAEQHALDNVAAPLGPPDVDTQKTPRRFIHRTVREHLVAEYVARLPVDQAAEMLLPHLWYDPDWEYAAHAALATHDQRSQLLRWLLCQAARSDDVPEDLSVIDAGWEFRGFLARVAAESSAGDWSPEIAEIISQARQGLAGAGTGQLSRGSLDDLASAAQWETSNRQVRKALLELMGGWISANGIALLMPALVRLAPAPEDKSRTRQALLALLDRPVKPVKVKTLVNGVIQLDPTAEDLRRARQTLLRQLDSESDGGSASYLVDGVILLDPTAEDLHRARQTLLAILASETRSEAAASLASGMLQLESAQDDMRRVRQTLLGIVASETNPRATARLVGLVVQLAPAAEDKREARRALLGQLTGHADTRVVKELVNGVVQLDATQDDMGQARQALLKLLPGQRETGMSGPVRQVVKLDPTAEDKHQILQALLRLLVDEPSGTAARRLVDSMVQLAPAPEEKDQARQVVLKSLAGKASPSTDGYWHWMGALIRLDPEVRDLHNCGTWPVTPSAELLAAARRNSALGDWLTVLPSLRGSSGIPIELNPPTLPA